MRNTVVETVGIFATIGGFHLIARGMDQPVPFFVVTCGLWLAWLVYRVRQDPGIWQRWGLTRTGLGPTLALTTGVAAIATVGLAAIGVHRGLLSFPVGLFLSAVSYPVFGLAQQFWLQSIFALGLAGERPSSGRIGWVTLLSAVLFALVHAPHWEQAAASGLMALVFTPIFLKFRNLWPLGVYHGLLGAMCHYWLLGRDVWGEVLSTL